MSLPTIEKLTKESGEDDGVAEFKLCGGGIEVIIYSLGGIIHSIRVPNKDDVYADVALGYETPKEYGKYFFGALIGRYANRICKGKFMLDGEEHQLACNNGPNHLHGGPQGFDKKNWSSSIADNKLVLTYTSLDGEESYPGTLQVKVTYEVTEKAELVIDYVATTSKPTIINLTNHNYFNLEGHDKGDIYNHTVMLNSSEYTPVDDTSIPTGAITSVDNTLFDLRAGKLLTKDTLSAIDNLGYDHNFLVPGDHGTKRHVGRVSAGGRVMNVYTTQPGVQFYTSNYVADANNMKDRSSYGKHCAFCLETQNYPDSPNRENFPSSVLRPGEEYHQTTWYQFSTQ